MGQTLYSTVKPAKPHPAWSRDAVIYELNVRQFTAEGTFATAAVHLDRLKGLGVDILWMMPIFPIGADRRKGSLGSYYSIRDYRAVNEEFGTLDDFRSFVREAQGRGMRVILDWVANHTSRDAVWTANRDWYDWDEAVGEIATPFDWTDTAKLNYTNPSMRRAMVDAMRYWLADVGIDGFRCDMAMLVPTDFWRDTIAELRTLRDDLFMLAEAEGSEFHEAGFDATYAWEAHHTINRLARGQATTGDFNYRLLCDTAEMPTDGYKMNFTSNHDENSWNGSEYERMGDAAHLMAALTFVLPGMPLIYNGQEAGLDRSLEFFDKDEITWHSATYAESLYRALCHLKHTNPALRAGLKGGTLVKMDTTSDDILAYKRETPDHTVIFAGNPNPWDRNFKVHDASFNGQYAQLMRSECAILKSDSDFYLPPRGFFIYHK